MARFLFYIPGTAVPCGGVSVILDWVRLLRQNGFEADAICETPGFDYKFGRQATPVLYSAEVARLLRSQEPLWRRIRLPDFSAPKSETLKLRDDDIIVVPEYSASWLPSAFPRHRMVLLVQAFVWLKEAEKRAEWDPARFCGAVAISEICLGFSRLIDLSPLYKVPLAIDTALFSPGRKENMIAYMPRRRADEVDLLVRSLKDRGQVSDYQFQPIDGLPLSEVASLLGRARIFLSFSEGEGFGLPPAEAMASGCIVIGYTGGGGDEFFDPGWSFPVPDGNLPRYLQKVEDVVAEYRRDPRRLEAMAHLASSGIAARYGAEVQEKELVKVFGELAGSCARAPVC
ncbi:glycosyltransferase family 4 protein [Paracoccus benzoatiresistens]|uniref:Glycosyltransferase family 4 protein n=1 Tax=Paracoccus benzoatiresistens TaxID=2997341 RepID=A0ABT4J2V4_9RHOB|nr:glycosyltransferase family 4 protein [Paracoccus sp. EF6]MCZ0961440.1 glycosyltransferase family 4 protein [Paracoccus sp. EF6]